MKYHSETCGEGWVPDQGEGVVEDVGGVQPRLTGVHYSCSIRLGKLDFHKLGDVQSKGDCGHRNDVDQESLGVGHGLGYNSKYYYYYYYYVD